MNKFLVKAVCLSMTLALVSGTSLIEQASAQSVQRLFSTPDVRTELDRIRFRVASGLGIDEAPVEEPLIEIPTFTDDEDEEVVYAMGGTMRKADGSYTVWLNDVAYDEANLPSHMQLLSPYNQGQLQIRDSTSGASYNLKPGQVLNFTTGQLFESYEYQAVLAAAAAEAARVAAEEAAREAQGTGSVILDSAPVRAVIDAAQDL